MTLDIYEIEGGHYQVDAPGGSFEFGPSKMRPNAVQCFSCHPPEAKSLVVGVLEAARAQGLPL